MINFTSIKFFEAPTVVLIVWIFLIGSTIISIFQQNYSLTLISIATLIVTTLPYIFQKKYFFRIPTHFVSAITFFIYATLFLGEAGNFYERFWWWDLALHAGSAIAFGLLGVTILLYLYGSARVSGSARMIAVFGFAFAMSIGALWEIFEFFMDQFFHMQMQRSGLVDTMGDLIMNAVGATIAAILGYWHIRHTIHLYPVRRGISSFIRRLRLYLER